MLNTYTNSLGKNLAHNLFIYTNANTMLDHSANSSYGNISGAYLFWTVSLEVYNTTFLVDVHACGQMQNFMFSKIPGIHVSEAYDAGIAGRCLTHCSTISAPYPFTFKPIVILHLKWVSDRQNIVGLLFKSILTISIFKLVHFGFYFNLVVALKFPIYIFNQYKSILNNTTVFHI